jgi:hypothetical protein
MISAYSNAQNFSYGLILGCNAFQVANDGGTSNFEPLGGGFVSNLGVYAEYSFTNKIGIKTEVAFNKKEVKYSTFDTNLEMSFFQITPSLKYDFGQEYRKGFYMLLGPKLSLITKVTSEGEDVKDAFKTTNFGIQYGVGTRIYKYFDLETKLDYEFSPFFEANGTKSSFFNFYINLGIDIERLLNK